MVGGIREKLILKTKEDMWELLMKENLRNRSRNKDTMWGGRLEIASCGKRRDSRRWVSDTGCESGVGWGSTDGCEMVAGHVKKWRTSSRI